MTEVLQRRRKQKGGCAVTELDYVGRCEHGVIMLWVSGGAPKVEVNREVREWLARGGSVERMSTEQARSLLGLCEVCESEKCYWKPHDNKEEAAR